MTPLSIAVERGEWRLVALQLLLGVSEAASQLPAESLTALIDLLGGADEAESKGGRRGR